METNHAHDDGAMGFILNKPIGKKVSDLVTFDDFTELGELPVYLGGPVSPDQLTFASLAWNGQSESLDFTTHLSSEEALHRVQEGFSVRAFVGYSGWEEGQLESELKQRAWITKKPEPLVMNPDECDEMWENLLKSMGPWYRLLADTPPDPSLN